MDARAWTTGDGPKAIFLDAVRWLRERDVLLPGVTTLTRLVAQRACDVGLEFLTSELQGSHDPSGVVFTVLAALSGMERENIRDRTLVGHESARKRGKTIGGASVPDANMLSMALHLRDKDLSLRDVASHLVITKGIATAAVAVSANG